VIAPEHVAQEKFRFVIDRLYEVMLRDEEAKALEKQISEAVDEITSEFQASMGPAVAGLAEPELEAAFRAWAMGESLPAADKGVQASPQTLDAPRSAAPDTGPPPQDFELHFTRGRDGKVTGPVLLKGGAGDDYEMTFARGKDGRISTPVHIRRKALKP
jgi:hypothetical protein